MSLVQQHKNDYEIIDNPFCKPISQKNKRINEYRKRLLKYINNETHIYISNNSKSKITIDESKNEIVYFNQDDPSHRFFDSPDNEPDTEYYSFNYLIYY